MTEHLQESQFVKWMIGEAEEPALNHMEDCGECRKEAVDFREQLMSFRQSIFAAGDVREIQWSRPADEPEVGSSIFTRTAIRWAPRAAFVALLLVLALTLAIKYRAPVEQTSASDAADNALLMNIESDLNQQAPDALQPAETLVAQMASSQKSAVDHSEGEK